MKSLKRTLCLVLALVMVLGLFGIASATDFTDDNTIQYKEAVEVVTGIGAIKGMGDGTFAPKATITRAQAAVMVARVALTSAIADDLKGVSSSFTDVTADNYSWAIPSIEYLVSKNIINGMGDGTFNPNGEISGYAVLKMLLCVLGYGVKDEYVGTGWDLQVAVDANKYGLTAGRLEGTPALSAPATREEVALYCFNALNTDIVEYNALSNIYAPGDTLGEDVYKLKTVEGVVIENAAINSTAAKNGTTKITPKTATNTDAVFALDTGLDFIGHYVRIYYTDASAAQKAKVPTLDGSAYSVVDLSEVKTVATTNAVNAGAGNAKVKAALQKVGIPEDVSDLAMNGKSNPYTITLSTDTTVSAASAKVAGAADAHDGTLLIVNNTTDNLNKLTAGTYVLYGGKVVSYIVPEAYVTTAVADYKAPGTGDGSVTIGNTVVTLPKDTTKSPTDAGGNVYKLYDGIAKKDVVIVSTTGAFKTVIKATPVQGKVTAMDTTKNTLTVNGSTYEKAASTGFATLPSGSDFVAGVVGQNCTIFLGPDGKVAGIVPESASVDKGLVYVVDAYVEETNLGNGRVGYFGKAQCVTMDGEEVVYTIGRYKKNDTSGAYEALANTNQIPGEATGVTATGAIGVLPSTYDSTIKGFLGKVTTEENELCGGTLATITAASGTTAVVDTEKGTYGKKASAAVTSKLVIESGQYFSDETVVLYVTGSSKTLKVTKATGPVTIASGTNYSWLSQKNADGSYDVKYVVISAAQVTSGSGIMFTPLEFGGTKPVALDNGKTGYAQTVYVDGELTTVVTKAGSGAANKGFYTFSTDADGYCVLGTNLTTLAQGVSANADEFASVVHNGLLTTAQDGTPGTAVLDNADASNAKIVDWEYTLAVATNTAEGKTPVTTLDGVRGKVISYTAHKGANNQDVVDVIYVMGNRATYTITPPAADVTSSGSGAEGVFTVKADKTSAATGDIVTVTVTVRTPVAAGKTATFTPTVTGSGASAANPTTLSFAPDNAAGFSKTFTFTVGTANVTITAISAEA